MAVLLGKKIYNITELVSKYLNNNEFSLTSKF